MPTLTDNVYNQLREMLANCEFEPGQRMPQRLLAKRLGCSPLPIVEALRRLESEGLISKDPRKSARVRKLSAEELEGVYMVREGLESVAARLAAQRITEQQSQHLSELGDQIEEAFDQVDKASDAQLDTAIHKFISKCAHCSFLADKLDRLSLLEQTAMANEHRVAPAYYRTSHRYIIQAIIDHDAEAAEYLMRKHIQRGASEHLLKVNGNG